MLRSSHVRFHFALALLLVLALAGLSTKGVEAAPDIGSGRLTVDPPAFFTGPSQWNVERDVTYTLHIDGITEFSDGDVISAFVKGEAGGVSFVDEISGLMVVDGGISFDYTIRSEACDTAVVAYGVESLLSRPPDGSFRPAHLQTVDDAGLVIPCIPDLNISKVDSADPVGRADFFSYQIIVSNKGTAEATDVVVTDILPKGDFKGTVRPFIFIDAKGSDCVETAPNTVECSLGVVLVGESVKLTLNVRAPSVIADQEGTNNVCVFSPDEPSSLTGDNCDDETTTLIACFDLDEDGAVFGSDISEAVSRFGAQAGDSQYDLVFDLDGNGGIFGGDIARLLQQFGEVCAV